MPRRRITKDELVAENQKYKNALTRIKYNAVRLQSSLCDYGTVHGDNRICDCKYVQAPDKHLNRSRHSEETGCCEAREILIDIEKALS